MRPQNSLTITSPSAGEDPSRSAVPAGGSTKQVSNCGAIPLIGAFLSWHASRRRRLTITFPTPRSVRPRLASSQAFTRAQPTRSATFIRTSVAESEIQASDPATEVEAPAGAEVAEATIEAPAAGVAAVTSDAAPASENPVREREGGRGQGGRGAGRGGRGGRGGGRPQRVFTVQLEDLVEGQELEGTVVRYPALQRCHHCACADLVLSYCITCRSLRDTPPNHVF